MGDATEDIRSGSGDGDEKNSVKPPEPEPPKVLDVELVVDGFGFMPKDMQHRERRRSSVYAKTKLGPKTEPKHQGGEEHSPCASSTNIDVVRRYTWKTKNRMLVQLPATAVDELPETYLTHLAHLPPGKVNSLQIHLQVITYGATITAISVPDRKGVPDDVLAGFDTLEEYFTPRNPYFGATIGRYANVIRDATMVVRPSGRMYMLSSNKGQHHYHGGYIGFDKVNWRSHVRGLKVIMSHVSERFHEGYPGTVMAQVTFEVTCDNTLTIEMKCTTTEPTIVNLSNSPFFNLAGHHAGSECMMEHIFTINADKYTATDEEGLVTGERKVVGGTAYDFRVPRLLKVMMPKIPMGGYDINFCVTRGTSQDLAFQARVLHPFTGRVLEVYSNQPGMQFYTGNLLPDPDKIVEDLPDGEHGSEHEPEEDSPGQGTEESSENSSARSEEALEEEREGVRRSGYVPLMGKQGASYKKHGLFCVMPQNYPDAINNKNFPSSVLNPGEEYVHRIQYKFGILIGRYI